MVWFKRVFLFLITNLLVMLTVSIVAGFVLRFLGVGSYSNLGGGLNYQALAVLCLVYGFTASLISLALSRVMAKWFMHVQVIDPRTSDPDLQWLVSTVHQLARSAGLPKMPEVGIYDSPEVNAFATGPTKSRALVAASSGLLSRMSRAQIEGVLGHEITHVANGDMVTMTLLQGVVNAFVMFFARIAAFVLSQNVKEESRYMVRFATTLVFEVLLGLLGAMVVAAFSRWREYRADAGGARLAGRDQMISALEALRRSMGYQDPNTSASVAALKISGPRGGLLALWASHPPLESRIARLQSATSL